MQDQAHEQDNQTNRPGILDTVSLSRQSAALRSFNPQSLILEYLEKLNPRPRERQILLNRFGLLEGKSQTLEEIGKKLGLTRERVRQIEKDCLKKLNSLPAPANFTNGADLIFQVMEENGNILSESRIFEIVLGANDSEVNRMGILFMLNLVPRFHALKESKLYHPAWYLLAFDQELFEKSIQISCEILENSGRPLEKQDFFGKIRKMTADLPELQSLNDGALESFLTVSKLVDKNPFQEWGLKEWPEIRPKDVGDKAYLVLSHNHEPVHYGKIAELINKYQFDDRVAQKETVHNELIKDARFVLVGRGIYALATWGYKRGIVAEIIAEILKGAGKPLTRDEIIQEVLKQRLVKKNTIIVGLSNKKRFLKTSDNKYTPTPKDAQNNKA